MKVIYSYVVISLVLQLGFHLTGHAQDLIVSPKGDSLNVKIVEESADSVKFKYEIAQKWHTLTVPMSDVKFMAKDFYTSSTTAGLTLGLLGGTSIISGGLEVQVIVAERAFLAYRIALGFNEELIVINLFGEPRKPEKFTNFMNNVTINYGGKRHFLEVGVGLDYVDSSYENNAWIVYAMAGYRFQTSKMFYKLFIVPVGIGNIPENMSMMPIGGTIGLRF